MAGLRDSEPKPVDGPRYYYLGPWVRDTSDPDAPFWRAPEGTVGLIDLRPLSMPVSTGFFSTDRPLRDSSYRLYATQLDGPIDPSERSVWQSQLGVKEALVGPTLLDLLWQTLQIGADPEGGTLCPPLVPTHLGQLEIHLGGHPLIWSRKFAGLNDPGWPKLQRLMQASYQRIKQEVRGKGQDAGLHHKWLECMRRKLGVPWQAIGNEEPVMPMTTISDTFDRADQVGLGTSSEGWSWTAGVHNILSNQARISTIGGLARAGIALSTDDHYSQADWYLNGSTNSGCGVATRCDASEVSCYVSYINIPGSANIYKAVAGVFTDLGPIGTVTAVSGLPVKLASDGSVHRLYYNGALVGEVTDSALSGQLLTGFLRRGGSGSIQLFDDFLAADLVASTGNAHYYHRNQ